MPTLNVRPTPETVHVYVLGDDKLFKLVPVKRTTTRSSDNTYMELPNLILGKLILIIEAESAPDPVVWAVIL